MLRETATARSISRAIAHHFTVESATFRILSVHDHACNLLAVGQAGEDLIAMVTPEHGNGPFHLVLDGPTWLGAQAGQLVQYDGDRLLLPAGVVSVASVQQWEARPSWPEPAQAQSALAVVLDVTSRHESFAFEREVGQFQAMANPYSAAASFLEITLADAPPDSKTREAFSERATSAIRALTCGVLDRDADLLARGAMCLAGLGPGLTPAGDDFLLGFMAGLFAGVPDQSPRWSASQLAETIAQVAASRTTRLSAAWLRCAGRGCFGAAWHTLAAGAKTNHRELINQAVERIMSTGVTSGRAAIAGFVAAARALEADN